MKNLLKISTILVLAVALCGALTLSAQATATLQLYDGSTTITITDNAAGDLYPAINGAILWAGSIGVWDLNSVTGQTTPFKGSASLPYLDLNTVNTNSNGSGTLTISFSQTDFTLANAIFDMNVGGTLGNGSITYAAYYDNANTLLNTATLIDSLTFNTPGAFSGSSSQISTATDTLYSLTQVITIHHNAPSTTSLNAELVPLPPSALLLGTGLLGLVALRRKKLFKR